MAVQKGKNLLMKIGTGAGSPEVFVTIAGLRLKQFQMNADTVDITHTESLDGWRELLAGAGVKSVALSGSGIFRDEASDERLRAAFFDQAAPNFELILPDFGTIAGPFIVTSLEYGGTHDGAMTFSVALRSAGAVSFTPVAP